MTHEIREDYLHHHWCPLSEEYSGCDSLLTTLDEGWNVEKSAIQEEVWFNGRRTLIYQFFLFKNDEVVRMRVIYSPYIEKIIKQLELRIIPPAPEFEMIVYKMR